MIEKLVNILIYLLLLQYYYINSLSNTLIVDKCNQINNIYLNNKNPLLINQINSNKYYLSLYIYKQQHGNLLVPQQFVIPQTNNWPKQLWDIKLGKKVNKLRQLYKNNKLSNEDINLLNILNFIWDCHDEAFNKFIDGIIMYKQLHNHIDIPTTFIFNQSIHSIPNYLHNYKLGFYCHRIRKGYLFNSTSYHRQLESLDFKLCDRRYQSKSNICKQLNTFAVCDLKDISNYLDIMNSNECVDNLIKIIKYYSKSNELNTISKNYVVDNKLLNDLNGLKFGKLLTKLKYLELTNQLPSKLKSKLKSLNIKLYTESDRYRDIISAFRIYEKLYQESSDISDSFVIPSTSDWPFSLHNVRLGEIYRDCVIGLHPICSHSLNTTMRSAINKFAGAKSTKRSDFNFEIIVLTLIVHQKLFGDMLVPRYYVVPSEQPWPECAWGLQIGNRVRNIIYYGAYNSPKHIKILKLIGFPVESIELRTRSNPIDY